MTSTDRLLPLLMLYVACGVLMGCERGAAPGDDANANAKPGDVDLTKMVEVEIHDVGLGAPMLAARLQIPEGWQARGGIHWDERAECLASAMRIEWAASSPDGARAIEFVPGSTWQVKGFELQRNPCPVSKMASVRDYLEALARERHAGGTIVDYRDRPDIVAGLQQQAALAHGTLEGGATIERSMQSGEVLVHYEENGQPVDETILATANVTSIIAPEARASRLFGVGNAFIVRAPAGQLDHGLAEAVRRSFRLDPQWQAQVQKHVAERAAAAQEK